MECAGSLIVIAIVCWVVYSFAYGAGKREGSRKGYGVGFDRGRRGRKSQSGCLIVLVVAGLGLGVTTVAFALMH